MTTPPKRTPRVMHVSAKSWITPNMIRVTCTSDWMQGLEAGIEGAHFKLFIPEVGQAEDAFVNQLEVGPRPTVRTYTIRHLRPELKEIDIDFVDHGDAGPASAWARRCVVGDVAGFAGPGPIKLKEFYADTYVIAADMSALPVAAATLEAMPRDATGLAFLEITSDDDRQEVDAPDGVAVHWITHPDPHQPVTQCVDRIASLPDFTGRVQTCIAGESGMIKALRAEIINGRGVPKEDTYISGYWKIGLIEDEHQADKRANS
ncbi:siderophore-interacting protein [Yoonia sp. I 8.24]|uniref:siderophore-interacting protein n=1 Tax=Yoonia sp. I 8.24 TaxID=1537229 RepID=UPI001EE123CD|nr:siderophore-interacting protein [Yoonia sp. I 8.24]